MSLFFGNKQDRGRDDILLLKPSIGGYLCLMANGGYKFLPSKLKTIGRE